MSELLQVRKLLSSAEPTTVRIANAPEVGDPEMQALQQARLLALGMRTMTLPLGRGALTLGTPPPLSLLHAHHDPPPDSPWLHIRYPPPPCMRMMTLSCGCPTLFPPCPLYVVPQSTCCQASASGHVSQTLFALQDSL